MGNSLKIMGILNTTPDSFSDGGKFLSLDRAIAQAQTMVEQGADIIDIGGESTRPGAPEVSVDDELKRVIPVIKSLRLQTDVAISIDTSKPIVMQKAVEAGASIINDVCALQNKGALEMAKFLDVNVCLMHMQGTPRIMQKNPIYKNVIKDVAVFFKNRLEKCADIGMNLNNIILDPGFGFGKNLSHNITLLKRLSDFNDFGLPILVGVSRKSMIGTLLDNRDVENRITGSVIAALIAAQNGANIIRVHDVLQTKDALTVWNKIKNFNIN